MKKLTTILLLLISMSNYAKERRVKLGASHRVSTTAAKLTGGIIQTTAGLSNIVFLPILDLLYGRNIPAYRFSSSARGEHIQLRLRRDNPINTSMGYSWGVVQVNPFDSIEAHEIGHSTATDTMGPLIIPYGIYDYIRRGHSEIKNFQVHSTSNLERHADMEAARDPTAVRRFNLGSFIAPLTLGLSFGIQDEASYDSHQPSGDRLHQEKRFEFLRTRIGQVSPDCSECESNFNGSFDLSRYLTRMTIGEGAVRPLFEGSYRFLSSALDENGNFRTDIATSENSAGFRFIISPDLMAYITAGVATRMTLFRPSEGDFNFDVMIGLSASGGVVVGNLFELAGGVREFIGTQMDISQSHLSVSRPITEESTNPVYVGVEAESEEVRLHEGPTHNIQHLRLTWGAEF